MEETDKKIELSGVPNSDSENPGFKLPIEDPLKVELCGVANCNSENPEFKLPAKDPLMRELWEDALSQGGKLTINKTTFSKMKICEKHFDEDDIIRDLKNELLGLPIKRKLNPKGKSVKLFISS